MERIQIANALRVNRPELGDVTGVGLYRLFRLVALEDILGTGAAAVSYYAGKKLGQNLPVDSLEAFLELCTQLRIGVIEVPELTETRIQVDVRECVTCAGMEPVGRPICHFEGGLIAGVIESLTGKSAHTREITCIGGLGDDACGFVFDLRPARGGEAPPSQ